MNAIIGIVAGILGCILFLVHIYALWNVAFGLPEILKTMKDIEKALRENTQFRRQEAQTLLSAIRLGGSESED